MISTGMSITNVTKCMLSEAPQMEPPAHLRTEDRSGEGGNLHPDDPHRQEVRGAVEGVDEEMTLSKQREECKYRFGKHMPFYCKKGSDRNKKMLCACNVCPEGYE